MKKFIMFLSIIALSISLAACKEKKDYHELVFNEALITFTEGDDFNHVTNDVSLALSSPTVKDAVITWTSSNTAVIKIEGNKGIITRKDDDHLITLSATVTIGKVTKAKDFTLKVIKLEQQVFDKIAPVITGTKNLTLTVGSEEPNWLTGIEATDNVDGTVEVKVIENTVNLSTAGTYSVTYEAIDQAGNRNTLTITVIITQKIDQVAPVITGARHLSLTVGSSTPDWLSGVTATDDVDGQVEVTVASNTVNLNVAGTYKIIYKAVDQAGNTHTVEIIVTVTQGEIIDTIAPVINGARNINLTVGSSGPDWLYGVTATDDVDGAVPVTIIENTVNLSLAGTYKIKYQATDHAGNTTQIEITVTVETILQGTTYVETFNNYTTTSNTYGNLSFTGINNINWTILGSRNDLALDGKAITFGGQTSDNSKISATIPGGISTFTVDLKKAYTNTNERKVELLINGISKGIYTLQLTEEVQKFEVTNINVSGEFTLELRQILGSSRAQITVDNLSWTSYSGVTIPTEKKQLDQDVTDLSINTQYSEAGLITLPSVGRFGSQISWSYLNENDTNNQYINITTKQVTLPTSGKVTVYLQATLTNGTYQATKSFSVSVGALDPISISSVRGLSNNAITRTIGVVTDMFQTQSDVYFFLQDTTAGIYVVAPIAYKDSIVVGNEIRLTGTKNIVNGQVQLSNISQLNVLGTKTITATSLTSPSQLNSYQGQLVEVTGLLLQNYSTTTTSFILINKDGRFELIIPASLSSTLRTTIQNLLTNKTAGLPVEIVAGVYRDQTKNQLLLINSSNIQVNTALDYNLIKEVLLTQVQLPNFPSPVTSNVTLTKDSDLLFGATIVWSSSHPTMLSNTGVVTQQATAQVVRLSYEIKLNTQLLVSGFMDVTVAAKSNFNNYYATISGLTGQALKSELTRIISTGVTSYSYSDTSYILDETDADPNKPGNVLLVYNRGTISNVWDGGSSWNKEHIWPQSKLGTASVSDLHNLKPCNPGINSSRGNDPYVDGSGTYGARSGGWFPGEADKGDIARIVFFMNTRWGLTIDSQIGNLQTFIKWHLEDPVDEFERDRNDVIYSYQKNRNPYIDHPELVEQIYGSVTLTTKLNTIKTSETFITISYDIDLTIFNRKYYIV